MCIALGIFVFVISVDCLRTEILLRYSIQEEQDVGSTVGDILGDAGRLDGGFSPLPFGVKPKLAVLPAAAAAAGPGDEYFAVTEDGGVLVVKSVLDRDRLCPETPDCVVTVEVAVIQPVENFRVFSVEVTIDDVNDHSPAFDHRTWTVSIPESALPGDDALFALPAARDADSGVNTVVRYEIRPDDRKKIPFSIVTSTNSDGSQRAPYLSLVERLDREVVAEYHLVVVAYDGGSAPRSGSMEVTVLVTDVNDNAPVFEFSEYNVTIVENLDVPTVIARVSAADIDEGGNGIVSYRMISHDTPFRVDDVTGEVSLVRSLGHAYREVYRLQIVASDRGIEPRTGATKLSVRIKDVNTHSPIITVNSLTTSGVPEVGENLPPGTFVAYLSVHDLDRGPNGEVTCRSTSSEFSLQAMHATTYKVVTTTAFDRERSAFERLAVECSDRGVPALTSVNTTRVVVLDDNDNVPVFDRALYEVSVPENVPAGQSIATVSASDDDDAAAGPNAVVVYALDQSSLDRRRWVRLLDGTNVIVAGDDAIDFETAPPTIRFQVTAFNAARPTLSSAATVLIHVRNLDDCPPVFTQASYTFGAFENAPVPTEVGFVSAVDCDAPPFDEFYYQLVAVPPDVFSMDPYSGKISTRTALDREAAPFYQFTVWVTDAHNVSLSSSSNVTVYVADKNDNAPEITFPLSDNDDAVFLSASVPSGREVATVKATDRDFGINSQLTYNLTSGSGSGSGFDESFFSIDPLTGVVTVAKSLAEVERKVLRIRISVGDRGLPSLSADTTLTVIINDSSPAAGVAVGSRDRPPKASAARSALVVSHQQILILLGAATGALALLLVVAIVLVRCRRTKAPAESTSNAVYLNPDNKLLSANFLEEDCKCEGQQTVKEKSNDKDKKTNTGTYYTAVDLNNDGVNVTSETGKDVKPMTQINSSQTKTHRRYQQNFVLADATDYEPRCRMGKTTNSDPNQDKCSTLNDILTHPSTAVNTVNYRYSVPEYRCCPASKIDGMTKHGTDSPRVLTTFLPNESLSKKPSSHRGEGKQVAPYDQKGRYSDFCITKNELKTTCLRCHSCRSTLVNTSDGLSEAGSSNSEIASSVSDEEAPELLVNAQDLSDPIKRTRAESDRFEEENVYIFNPITYISETFASEDEEQ